MCVCVCVCKRAPLIPGPFLFSVGPQDLLAPDYHLLKEILGCHK